DCERFSIRSSAADQFIRTQFQNFFVRIDTALSCWPTMLWNISTPLRRRRDNQIKLLRCSDVSGPGLPFCAVATRRPASERRQTSRGNRNWHDGKQLGRDRKRHGRADGDVVECAER